MSGSNPLDCDGNHTSTPATIHLHRKPLNPEKIRKNHNKTYIMKILQLKTKINCQ